MERVQQVYKVILLDETYLLSVEDFTQFQRECLEIAGYGMSVSYQVPTYETKLLTEHLEQAEVQPLIEEMETKNWVEVLDKVVENEAVVKQEPIKVHNDKLKDLIDTMPKTAKIGRDAKMQKYVDMHEAGVDMIAIKNAMLKDKICAESSLPYFMKKVLAASTKVTKVVEYVGKTDDQIIEELKQKNKDTAESRQKPKISK